jgi:hypothetical protein
MVASGQRHAMPRRGRFTPGKSRYPLYRRLAGPQGRSGRLEGHSVRKNSAKSRTCVYMYRKEGAGLTGTQLFTTTAFIVLLFIEVATLCYYIRTSQSTVQNREVHYIMFVKLYNWKHLVTEGRKYLPRGPHVGQYCPSNETQATLLSSTGIFSRLNRYLHADLRNNLSRALTAPSPTLSTNNFCQIHEGSINKITLIWFKVNMETN